MSFFELPYMIPYFLVGNDNIKNKDITEVITAKTGAFLEDQALHLAREAIRSLYQKKGYADADVESECSIDEATN